MSFKKNLPPRPNKIRWLQCSLTLYILYYIATLILLAKYLCLLVNIYEELVPNKSFTYSGDRALNGSHKLSLATSALCLLNNLFVEILNDGWIADSNSSFESVEDDVKFLYDFMKNIPSLKVNIFSF